MSGKAKTHQFRTETRKVLNILTHSLYTNREIFLRELLSNASDALEKLRYLQSKGEMVRDAEMSLEIAITTNQEKGVLQVADTGIGMSEQEMITNLGTIAKSGSEQFLHEMGDEQKDLGEEATKPDPASAAQIIGRFGIGFYSVFMVADEVEVISVAAVGDEPPHAWTSNGSGTFTMRTLEGDEAAGYKRGTVIRAKLKDDAKEFLQKYRLESVSRAHSNFLPFPILLEGDRINTTPALWREPKFSVTKEQYAEFYKYLTFDSKAPLDVIHLSVDAPVQFTALMFIPDSQQEIFGDKSENWGLDLYVRRVLIERGNKELVPNYMAFIKGVADTEDLPLNISRETLQENIVLRKISQTIVKQIFLHLEKMAETDKEKYEEFWKLHGRYFKFAFNDYLNRDRVAPLMRFYSSAVDGEHLTSLDDYLGRAKAGQKEIWYVAAPSREAAKVNPHLERFRQKGLEILYLVDALDELTLENLDEYKKHPFKSVEQAESNDLADFPDIEEEAPKAEDLSEQDKTDFDKLLEAMQAVLGDKVTEIRVSQRLSGSPAVLASPEGRTSSMERLMRVMQKDETVPHKVLEINRDHSMLRALLRIFKADAQDPLIVRIVNNLYDNLLLMEGYLNEPYLMADRNIRLMGEAASWYADLRKL